MAIVRMRESFLVSRALHDFFFFFWDCDFTFDLTRDLQRVLTGCIGMVYGLELSVCAVEWGEGVL